MKQLLILSTAALLLTACANSFNADKVHVGMSKDELIAACGKPDQVIPWMFVEVYKYDKAGVTIMNDTVSSFSADVVADMKSMQSGMDGLKDAVKGVGETSPSPSASVHRDLSFVSIGMNADTMIAHIGEPDQYRDFGNSTWWLTYGDQVVETRNYNVARIMMRAAAEDSIGGR